MSKYGNVGGRHTGFGTMCRLAALLVSFVWIGSLHAAQLRIGDNFPISGGSGFESAPAVAVNSTDGRFLVVWTSTEPSAIDPTISVNRVLARLVSSTGQPSAEGIVISQRFSSDQTLGGSNPDVAYNSVDDEFLVIYERTNSGTSENGIFAQRVGPDGALRGDEITVFKSFGQASPAIAHDPVANRYLAVWTGSNDTAMFGSLLGNTGIAVGPVTPFSPLGQATKNPAIAFNAATGQYLLVYEGTSAITTDIFGRLIDNNAVFVDFNTLFISTAAGAQLSPHVLVNNASNQFLVTWGDDSSNVSAQLVDGGGAMSGGNVQLLANAAFPRIVYSNQQKRYLLNWVSRDNTNANNGFLLGHFLQPNLTTKSADFRISDTSAVGGQPALAAYQHDSIALSVWPRKGDDGVPKIWGQLINLSTVLTKLSLTVAVSPKTVDAGQPLTYTIRVKNNGAARGTGVELTDTIPKGAEFVSAAPSVGTCSNAGATVTCALGNLPANGTANVVLVVRPTRLGVNRNKAVLDWSNNAAGASKTTVITESKVVYPGNLTVVAPNGGETLPTGSLFDIVWDLQGGIPGDTVEYKLQYSTDSGGSWKTIANGVTGNRYPWTVPTASGNKFKSLVRVTGRNRDNVQIDSDRSDKPFVIEVLHLNTPAAGDVVNSGHALNVVWTTHATRAPVGRTVLSYSLNGGEKWGRIAVVDGNPGNYLWTIPQVANPSPKSKVKVVLKSQKGATLGSVVSGPFTIMP